MKMRRQHEVGPDFRTLAKIELFQGLSVDVIHQLSDRCLWKQYSVKEHIIEEQDASRGVFFIVRGKVRISYHSCSGHEIIFQDRYAGDLFGELATIDGKSRSASAVSIESSLIAFMAASSFLELLNKFNPIQMALLLRFSDMVRNLSDRITEISTFPVRQRIYLELLRLARRGTTSDRGIIILPAPTHAEIANLVGTHREAVSRELSVLASSGIVKKRRRMLVITDIQKLHAMSSSEICAF